MRNILLVAWREFTTTARSKGFIFGLLLMPLLALIASLLIPRIQHSVSPQVHGAIAVIDPTGRVTADLATALKPAAILARREASAKAAGANDQVARYAANAASVPQLTIIERPVDADIQQQKDWLLSPKGTNPEPLAVVVVANDAVTRRPGAADYGTYDLFVSPHLNADTEGTLRESLRQAVIGARLKANGADATVIDAALRLAPPEPALVDPKGEHKAGRGVMRALPFICGIMLFMAVITGGQVLMTSTVEEKSSRVVEVLLAAVSPVELMAGKLLGQMGIGILMVCVYLGIGVVALVQFSLFSLLNPALLLYMVVFYIIAYLVYGSLMLAVGAAVSQLADAQSLMGPIMILLIIPYVLTPVIGSAPNSHMSVALSFIPPINSFAMLARIASDTPPPLWQVLGTIVVGLASAAVAVWFAAKIFRISLLMHGKPPSIATLIRWAREA